MKNGKREQLEAILHYRFQNPELLEQALTHTSYANEILNDPGASNERLEFLGDAVLELVTSQWLFRHRDLPEGKLSRLRAMLVCEESLSQIAQQLGLGAFLALGHGAERNGERNRPAILEDLLESLFGAVYLDGGLEAAQSLIERLVLSHVPKENEQPPCDYKSELQEWIQERAGTVEYRLRERSGPPHMPTFVIDVLCCGKICGSGSGHSKKEAQQKAAAQALQKLINQQEK